MYMCYTMVLVLRDLYLVLYIGEPDIWLTNILQMHCSYQ